MENGIPAYRNDLCHTYSLSAGNSELYVFSILRRMPVNELKKYLLDIRFILPAAFLLLFELFLQSGLYRNFLRPKSYAANVNNIIRTVKNSRIKPNILILGTSVAYQGINLPLLNSLLEKEGLRVQSGATEGAVLINQHLIFRNLIQEMPDVKLLLHFSEISYPWTSRYLLDVSNRSMAAQFPRKETLELLSRYEYDLSPSDYSYFTVRSITYQSDLRDFVSSPLYRIKLLSRENKEHKDFPYENNYTYSMAVIQAKDLNDCINNFPVGLPQINEKGERITDRMHMEAMLRTCNLAKRDPMNIRGAPQWKNLFFKRLKIFIDDVQSRNIKVITVLPPYSQLIQDSNEKLRLSVWEEELKKIHNGRESSYIDLRHSLDGNDNSSLYYDTIHLNREGSIRLTKKLAEQLKEIVRKEDLKGN